MKILVLGGGGREHALVWAITQNPKCQKIFCAPGNAGISKIADIVNLDILQPAEIVAFCKNEKNEHHDFKQNTQQINRQSSFLLNKNSPKKANNRKSS